jgi:hypothetical protein
MALVNSLQTSGHLEELEAQQVLRHIPADKRGDFGYEKGQADMWQAIV